MKTFPFLCAAGLALPLLAFAQGATLAPQAERINDTVIQQDYTAFERVQARIKALNDGGRRVADYHLSKAQCWLDVSFHEYTRNDRSAFPQAAMTESDKLVAAMETRVEPLPNDTPLVNGAARLRPDLWERLGRLKQGAGAVCAAQAAACAEIELVHAGNEFNQQGWRHAKPYVQIAEDLVGRATAEAEQCPAARPRGAIAAPVPQTPAPAPAPIRQESRVTITANVVFGFDRSARADIRPGGREQLETVLRSLSADGLRVVAVKLIGHADRLNGTGNSAYNRRLSERRAETVRALLIERGIEARTIEASAVGDAGPVESCSGKTRSRSELEECLLPNRNVEVVFLTVKAP